MLNRGYTLNGTDTESSTSFLAIGFSDDVQMLDNVFILLGGFFIGNLGGNVADHHFTLTGYASAEFELTSFFAGRVGISKNFWTQDYIDSAQTTTNNNTATRIDTGFSLLFFHKKQQALYSAS